jgi:hypothetical protein
MVDSDKDLLFSKLFYLRNKNTVPILLFDDFINSCYPLLQTHPDITYIHGLAGGGQTLQYLIEDFTFQSFPFQLVIETDKLTMLNIKLIGDAAQLLDSIPFLNFINDFEDQVNNFQQKNKEHVF